ncbi:hypothetical protein CDCA_CDCA16G4210 [Cyanidium caldarium]|uniref:Mitochondrial import inner membrane translocase subunit TIM50 n=1 Tax=Cyanidium caldarium TaxID=2771 RepID=A0AAV9J1I8_CYACA|nr:hypothetical protein CDCA_CDCA16G4210 [Cyanidium caldarium]
MHVRRWAEVRRAALLAGRWVAARRPRPTVRWYSEASAAPSAPAPPAAERWRLRLGRLVAYAALGSAAAVTGSYFYDPSGTLERIRRVRDELESRYRYYVEPSRDKLLPDPIVPYPGAQPPRTLVLDLDETLIHSEWTRTTGWRTAKRPGVDAFLAYMAQFYEVVVFTSALPGYADPILDKMDPNGYIAHRLYRHETKYRDGLHVKDLSKLNRDLRRTIIIDNDPRLFALQPDNGVAVSEWRGDDADDTELLRLATFLEWVARSDVEDVRQVIALVKSLNGGEAGKPFMDQFQTHRAEVEALVAKQRAAAANAATTAAAAGVDGGSAGGVPGVARPGTLGGGRGLGIFGGGGGAAGSAASPMPPSPPISVPDDSIWSRLRR